MGADVRGDELPAELRRREDRLAAIRAANFLHFTMMTVALMKALIAGSLNPSIAAFAAPYLLFTASFGRALVSRPAAAATRRPQSWGGAGA